MAERKNHFAQNTALLIGAAAFTVTFVVHATRIDLNALQTDVIRGADIPVTVVGEKKVKIKRASEQLKKAREMWRKKLAQAENESVWPVLREVHSAAGVSCEYTKPEEVLYQGEFIKDAYEVHVGPDGTFRVSVYIRNTGNVPWFSGRSGCGTEPHMRLGTSRDLDRASIFYTTLGDISSEEHNWLQANRIELWEPRVEPGELATFSFVSTAPKTNNEIFREYFRPVVDGVTWLQRPEEEVRVDIFVGEDNGLGRERLKYVNKSLSTAIVDSNAPKEIEVDVSEQTMKFIMGGTVLREYYVSTGTFNTPTPLSRGEIVQKQELRIARAWPHYRMPKWQSIAYDKNGGKFVGYGLHSLPYLADDDGVFWNEALDNIGQRVSHGCIRLMPEDAEDLFNLTDVGTTIWVHE